MCKDEKTSDLFLDLNRSIDMSVF